MGKLPRQLIVIIVMTFLLRMLLLLLTMYGLGEESLFTADSRNFYKTAVNLAAGRGFTKSEGPPFIPEAHFPPLYPLLIAGSIKISGSILPLIILQILLASFLPLLVWELTGKLIESEKIRLLAAGLMAFEPLTILWSLLLLTEVTSGFTLIVALWFFIKFLETGRLGQIFFSGMFLGVSTLIRPQAQFLFIPAFLFLLSLGLFKIFKKSDARQIFAGSAIFILIFFAVLSPWLIRNYYHFGSFSISTTGLRNLYTAIVPAIYSLEFKKEFGEAQEDAYQNFLQRYGSSPQEIQENPALGKTLAKEGIRVMLEYPKRTAQVLLIALNAFFTQDLYTDYLQRFKLLPRFQIDFSPSVILLTEGPLALAQVVWERLGPYSLIPMVGRLLWVIINIFWITGAITAIKAGGKIRMTALIFTAIILYYAATSSVAGFADHGRFRYPASPLMFILASYGFYSLLKKVRHQLLKVKIS